MKALSFEYEGQATYGLMDPGAGSTTVREVAPGFRRRHADLRAVLDAGALRELPRNCSSEAVPAGDIRFLPTIPNPRKIICVGVNYRPHVAEMGRTIPDYPLLFVRFPESLVGHAEPLVKPSISDQYDYEGEVAIVIGRRARAVSREQAMDCIAGYTVFMDGSVRDWQRHTSQFIPGKNFMRSGAMGPCLVTPDELPPPGKVLLETRVNGVVMQRGALSDLIFDIPALIEYCSAFTELAPGDVIATGTPGGVGAARTPPVWLRHKDRVEVEVTAVGCLFNPVGAE